MFRITENSSGGTLPTEVDGPRSFFTRGVAFLCALGLTAALTAGWLFLSWRHAKRLRAEEAAQSQLQKPSPAPKAQVFVDEAMIKASQAVLGGTIQNISTDTLVDVTLELELKRRKDGTSEVRVLAVEPKDLRPQQKGRYSLNVSSHEFRESRIKRIKSGPTMIDIPFKIVTGAQRPSERLPENKNMIVKPSPRRGNGEEFINTPDNPVSIP